MKTWAIRYLLEWGNFEDPSTDLQPTIMTSPGGLGVPMMDLRTSTGGGPQYKSL
jgi:hypothetical protein